MLSNVCSCKHGAHLTALPQSGREKAPCLIDVNAVKRALVQARRPFNSIAASVQGKDPCTLVVIDVKCELMQARRKFDCLEAGKQGKRSLPACRRCCQLLLFHPLKHFLPFVHFLIGLLEDAEEGFVHFGIVILHAGGYD